MKKTYLTYVLLASAMALAGCGGAENQAAAAGNTSNAAAPAAPEGNAAGGEAGATQGGETAGAQQNFTINNNTGHTVMTLNVSPSNEDQWGPDILGSEVLANGQSAQVSFERGEEQCLWDIRATYDDGDTTDVRGVNLCEVATVNLTGGE